MSMMMNKRTTRTVVLVVGIAVLVAVILSVMSAAITSPSSSTTTVVPPSSAPSAPSAPSVSKSVSPSASKPPLSKSASKPSPSASKPAAADSAAALLATLAVKGPAPKTGYDRTEKFGSAWKDVDANHCDTRNDILNRDLTDKLLDDDGCTVLSGVLADPYTGTLITFVRGVKTSSRVQIDHVVALMNAWQSGAQQFPQDKRVALANDPLNLLAVDGPQNSQKGASNAASWLPKNKAFRCRYVARQVTVKAKYGLWVTQSEHDAIARILDTCPKQKAAADVKPAVKVSTTAPSPSSSPSKTNTTVHPGTFCSPKGSKGVTEAGTHMVCSAKKGKKARWRSA